MLRDIHEYTVVRFLAAAWIYVILLLMYYQFHNVQKSYRRGIYFDAEPIRYDYRDLNLFFFIEKLSTTEILYAFDVTANHTGIGILFSSLRNPSLPAMRIIVLRIWISNRYSYKYKTYTISDEDNFVKINLYAQNTSRIVFYFVRQTK